MLAPRRRQRPPRPAPQGEAYEILKARRAKRRASDVLAQELLEQAGHLAYPFLRDPFG